MNRILNVRAAARRLSVIFVAFLFQNAISAQEIPVIRSLTAKDMVFAQYMDDLEKTYQAIARDKPLTPSLYQYTAVKGDTVFSVAARCSIPYDTLATLNRLDSIDANLEGKTLILPAAPGLFVPEIPETTTEYLLARRYGAQQPQLETILVNSVVFSYNRSDKFSAEERVFFVDPSMKLPVARAVLTSPFGMRVSPITGEWRQHNGVDLGAPMGTEVTACKAGVVSFAGQDSVLGNYVIITHASKTQSLYAHLSAILVTTGKSVKTGTAIGKVGATGAATGPHLHFEIRVDGKARDPRESVKGLR
ncbi:MAG: M23 family metallopeptidase [Treponemataceae bacterium]|nr:MAG: M23 family metallopeptidase [Treponemataceae bacterium]